MASVRVLLFLVVCFGICHGEDSLLDVDYSIDSNTVEELEEHPRLQVWEDKSWTGFPHLKQVTGLGVDSQGNLHIFHRCDRVWDSNTYHTNNTLRNIAQGPIKNDTVIVVNPVDQVVLYTWGANRFYMPHGLNVDTEGNVYVTDVGLHQVMRFPAGQTEPDLILGTALVPGSDKKHFCKPSDALVADSGHIFVSDGYCNRRVVLFSNDGQFIKEFGAGEAMRIPHSLTLVPEHSAICLTDREDDRILCFSTGADGKPAGTLVASIRGQGLRRVFAADARGKDLFVVNGPELNGQSLTADHGIVINIETGMAIGIWQPEEGFLQPHDIAVSLDGKNVYVCEIDLRAPKHVYKFHIRDV